MSARVFNMPSGTAFLPSLAAGLREEFGDSLQDGLILLPTRRAVRAMGDAFVMAARGEDALATLLPRMRPLADVNPEEPPFEPGELVGKVAPAIDPMLRRFELAQLIARYHERAADLPLDPAAALAMADPLLSIMDDAAMEEVRFTDTQAWQDVTAEAAIHFQHAATLYKIIEDYWPKRLAELGVMEAQARKVALLNLLTDTWETTPPNYPVIIAGSTGTLKATARLMRCVANMPNGRIVLPGLQDSTDDVWNNIDVQHPQYSLKNLLGIIGVERQNVRPWPAIEMPPDADLPARRLLLSEALVPVSRTSDWLGRIDVLRENGGEDIFARATNGLSLIEAPTDDAEALTIALIMRGTLETLDQTAALVTPDQALAARVKARLTRWNINVDMSQGGLLSETPLGVFLDSLLDLCQDETRPAALSVVFNHLLCGLGLDAGEAREQWQVLEREKYRGIPNPDRGPDIPRGEDELVKTLIAAMAPLLDITDLARADVWTQSLIEAAETIAANASQSGEQVLWAGEAGARAAGLLQNLIAHGQILPEVDAASFARLLQSLMGGVSVRPKSGTHPRLSILGPLEARMLSADVIILGGLNEGIWPVTPKSGPFLSRGMRRAMKLSLPERRYGLAAHDFAELAANPKVYLTRAKRSASGPMIASRWVWRLQTLLRGALGDERAAQNMLTPETPYLDWASALDRPEQNIRLTPPEPRPPVDKRWAYAKHGKAGLSITAVQTWIRDPYAIYARYCLGLKGLEPLDAQHGAREFGSAVHKGIEDFLGAQEDKTPFSLSQTKTLTQGFKTAMAHYGFPPEDVAKEHTRFAALAENFINWLIARNHAGFDIMGQEVWAEYQFPDADFNLRGVIDLVERRPDGYSFIDHKTGAPSSAKVVSSGFDPQLPLAAFLAEKGGLKGMDAAPTCELGYLRVKGSNDGFEHACVAAQDTSNLKTAQELADEAAENLRKLIKAFGQEQTAYHSQPRAQYVNKYGDYDDLARRAEWSAIGGEDAS